jgi:FixJ family two-component response regulator
MVTRKRIVVVEDDTSMLRSIERLLKVHGFDCACFECVEDFREQANLDEAACLVLDINLNNASGIELSKEVTRAGHSLPVVFITGADNAGVRSAANKTGCVAYLTKPFPPAALIEAVEKSVERAHR